MGLEEGRGGSGGKIHPLPPMPLGKKRLLGLHHSFHTTHFQIIPSPFRFERLASDVLKDLNGLRGISSLPRGDEVGGIASISLRKLKRASTSGLLQVGTVFSVKPGDSSEV